MPELVASAGPGRLPAADRSSAGQVRYQLLLTMRNPRALVAGVALPLLLLVLTSSQHAHLAVSALAGRIVLGVTLTA